MPQLASHKQHFAPHMTQSTVLTSRSSIHTRQKLRLGLAKRTPANYTKPMLHLGVLITSWLRETNSETNHAHMKAFTWHCNACCKTVITLLGHHTSYLHTCNSTEMRCSNPRGHGCTSPLTQRELLPHALSSSCTNSHTWDGRHWGVGRQIKECYSETYFTT